MISSSAFPPSSQRRGTRDRTAGACPARRKEPRSDCPAVGSRRAAAVVLPHPGDWVRDDLVRRLARRSSRGSRTDRSGGASTVLGGYSAPRVLSRCLLYT